MKAKLDAGVRELGEVHNTLEKRNAWLKKSNIELEDILKRYTLKAVEVKAAEERREARADAEFEKRKKEADEDIERRIEEGKVIVESEVRRWAGESARQVPALQQRAEELQIRLMALSIQIGEKSSELLTELWQILNLSLG